MSQTNRCLSETWWKVSKEDEYKKNNNLKASDVMLIKDWIRKKPHLPQLNDNQIIMFLRVCDYSLELSKKSIDLNYTTRSNLPEFFSKRDLDDARVQTAMEHAHFGVIPDSVNNDCYIICKVLEVDLSKFILEDFIKYCFMFHDMTHLEFGSCDGYIYIVDMKNVNLALLLRLQISVVGHMLKFWQDCSTYRIKAFHIVNGGHIFKRVLQVFQQFFNSELLKLIHLHDNFETLKEFINSDIIPSEYGGLGKSLKELQGETDELLEKYKDWFREEENQRIDESKKNFSRRSTDESIQGSFRKLDID
ncbi:hypothetical protein O3M35_008568 [Rhynocoris fuscipes]|uniref:CRAL-TRIO domain-containing protein n=1 Tax=Rhynocoris fuscipes TaxID=488301 RepID=A0AAW1D6R2_9HEMI